MFDFLIIGHKIEVNDTNKPFSKVYGNAIRSVNVATELVKLGFKVGLVVEFTSPDITRSLFSDLVLVSQKKLEQFYVKAKVLIFSTTKPEVLSGIHGINPQNIKHKRKILLSCFVSSLPKHLAQEAYEGFDLITVNNYNQQDLVKKVSLKLNVRQLDFGALNLIGEIRPFLEPKGLWVGSIRHPEILVKIFKTCRAFDDVNFSIVSRLIFDCTKKLKQSERPIEHAVVNLLDDKGFNADVTRVLSDWCGMSWPDNLRFLGGVDDDYESVLFEHNFGLDFSRSVGQKHDNTKTIDYLSTGMYVLTEELAPSVRYVKEMDNGFVIHDFDSLQTDLNLFHELSTRSRVDKRTAFIDKYGWQKVVEKLLAYLPGDYLS
ncbi:hypothetical protein [Paraglaciecola sp. 2405UD69-4]|uniref:hypothetical protein n=1 Tax=Paraglaciecola sp. 2405UD69-4 TaxID=3391836 RepID=UPI0039C98C07